MNTPPVLDRLSDRATATGQDLADSSAVRGVHDVGARVADGVLGSARSAGAKVDGSASALAGAVSAVLDEAGKRAGKASKQTTKKANKKAAQLSNRGPGRRTSGYRVWGWVGVAALVAAGAGAVVVWRRSGSAASPSGLDGQAVADPR